MKLNALKWGARGAVLLAAIFAACGGGGGEPPRYTLVEALEIELPASKWVGLELVPGSAGEAVVITQGGPLFRVQLDGGEPPAAFGDLTDRIEPVSTTLVEHGVLGLAFSPNFESNGRAYIFYTGKDPFRGVLARFQVVDGALDMESERVLLEVPELEGEHNGGQLKFGPDGYLYLAIGDGVKSDPHGYAQDLARLPGSILRLDVSGDGYEVPPDNPFVAEPNARAEIYAYGLRNPWRFSFDRKTGQLWSGDVGHSRWEEINQIMPGINYGWNIMEGNECFNASDCEADGLEPPYATYSHQEGCAIIGGFVYRGSSMPELTGHYIYGDFCNGGIWAVNANSNETPVLLTETDHVISSFTELPDGELLAVSWGGAILRLQHDETPQ